MWGKKKFSVLVLSGGLVLNSVDALAQKENAVVTNMLDTVVVTADRGEGTKREVTSNITVIDSKTLEISSAGNLGDLMSQQGLQIRKYPGVNSSVGIRGFRTDSHGNDLSGRVLVLINGRRAATGNLAKIPTINIERVEIIKGPASVQYGSAAMGGVINVITKKGGDRPFAVAAEAGLGSFDRQEAALNVNGRQSGFDYSSSYSYYSIDDYDLPNGDRRYNTGVDSINTFDAALGYTFFDRHRIGLEFNYYQADEIGNSSADYNTPRLYDVSDKGNRNLDFTYNGASANQAWSWMARYSFGKDEDKNYSRLTPSVLSNHNEVDTKNLQAQLSYDHGLFHLTGGIDYTKYEITYSGTPRNSDYTNTAGFLLGKLRLFDEKLIISGGGRYDDYKVTVSSQEQDNKETHFSPSIGLAYNPVEWFKVRANYAKGFRMPSYTELGYIYIDSWGIYGNYYGNPSLKPEKSSTWEAGFDVAYNGFDFSLTYFESDLKDYIVTVPIGASIDKTYANLPGKSKRNGLEVETSLDFGVLFDLEYEVRPYANVNYMTKYKDEAGNKLPYVPRMTLGYGLRLAAPEHGLRAGLNFSYFGKEKVDDWNYSSSTYGQQINHGSFTVASLTAEKTLLDFEERGRLDLKFEVNNLFDEDYAYVLGYPMPGRNFYVGAGYKF